jgi:hypothetical protein
VNDEQPPLRAGLWAATLLLLLAACGGGDSGFGVSGSCAPPAGTRTALVYPAPGSRGIPDDFGLVILGSTAALPPTYQVHVVSSARQALLFENMSPAPHPLPVPNTPAPFADPVYQSSANPGQTFAAGTTVSVYLNNENGSSYCLATLLLGSFAVR